MLRIGFPVMVVLALGGSFVACGSNDEQIDPEGGDAAQDDATAEDNATAPDEAQAGDDDTADDTADDNAADDTSGSTDGAGGAPEPSATTPVTDPSAPVTAPSGSATPPAPTATVNPNLNPVGAPCQQDGHCQTGLTCLTDPEFFAPGAEGTVPGGFCTASCNLSLDTCGVHGANITCIARTQGTEDTSDDVGYCMQACIVGNGLPKCYNLPDQVCLPLSDTGQGACFPYCMDDLACTQSEFCDPISGMCVSAEPEGKGYGEACAVDDECVGGRCLLLEEGGEGFCTGRCVYYGEQAAGCGFTPPAEGEEAIPPDAVCAPLQATASLNDPGLCLPVCDTDEDCKLESMQCSIIDDPVFPAAVGRLGVCSVPDALADGGAPLPPEPEADAATPPPPTASDAGAGGSGDAGN